jgi:hypothetical protein
MATSGPAGDSAGQFFDGDDTIDPPTRGGVGRLRDAAAAAWQLDLPPPGHAAAAAIAERLLDAIHRPGLAEPAVAEIRRHGDDVRFWASLWVTLGPTRTARLLDEIGARQDQPGAIDPATAALCATIGDGLVGAFARAELDPSFGDAFLDAAAWDDLYRLVDRAGAGGPLAGLLAARLTELGETAANLFAQQLGRCHYAEAMHRLGQLLPTDAAARRAFATCVRVLGRPVEHRSSACDGWVAGLLDAELMALPPADQERLRIQLILKVAAQGFIHADFAPVLMRMAGTGDTLRQLAAAAAIEPDQADAPGVRLDRRQALDFLATLLRQVGDSLDLEAAGWAHIRRQLAAAAASPEPACLQRALAAGARLLALLDDCQSGSLPREVGVLASEDAVAEFVFLQRSLLRERPELLKDGRIALDLAEFIRRDGWITLHGFHLDRTAFEQWCRGKTRHVLLAELGSLEAELRALQQLPPQGGMVKDPAHGRMPDQSLSA